VRTSDAAWGGSKPTAIAISVALTMLSLALAACSIDDGAGDHFDVREPGKFVEWMKKHHPADSVTYSDVRSRWSSKGAPRAILSSLPTLGCTFS
jgi:hypothetical protein